MKEIRPVLVAPFSPTSLACIRSWGAKGCSVGLVCVRNTADPVPSSRYLTKWCTLEPEFLFAEQGLQKIAHFVQGFQASGLMAINEQVSRWLWQTGFTDCPLWVPNDEVLECTMSKSRQLTLAKKAGLSVLPVYYFGTDRAAWPDVSPECFPLCLRPSDPGAVSPCFKATVVDSSDELFSFLDGLEERKDDIVAQPFRDVPNLVVHGARALSGSVIGLQAFLVERKFEGVTLSIRPFPLAEELAVHCDCFVQELNLTGPFHFEFLYDREEQHYWFLEINPRLGGTTAKVFALGYDEPGWALQAFCEEEVVRMSPCKGIATSHVALLKYVVQALRGRLTPLDHPREPLCKRLLSAYWALGYKDDVFSLMDLPGTLAYYWGMVKTRFLNG